MPEACGSFISDLQNCGEEAAAAQSEQVDLLANWYQSWSTPYADVNVIW